MRVTLHNGRVDKNGKAFTTRHNDRNNFTADHIDSELSSKNHSWHRFRDEDLSFDECEKKFYEIHFSDALNARNERYRRQRHLERIRSIDEYRSDPRSCPEEDIFQIGRRGESIDDPRLLWKICVEMTNWEQRTFPNIKYLDISMHLDEPGAAYHIHRRKVWIAHDKDGEIISQNKALKEMGIERPDPSKNQHRYNNPKQTYTRMCREHLIELCRQHGLEIEDEPREPGRSGLALMELKADTLKKELSEAQKALSEAQKEIDTLKSIINDLMLSMELLEEKKGHLLKSGEIDLMEYRKAFLQKGKYIISEGDLRDLKATAAAHNSIDSHILEGKLNIKKLENKALKALSEDLEKIQKERDSAVRESQELRIELNQIRGFISRICDRSDQIREWNELYNNAQLSKNNPRDAQALAQANKDLRSWEKENGFSKSKDQSKNRDFPGK